MKKHNQKPVYRHVTIGPSELYEFQTYMGSLPDGMCIVCVPSMPSDFTTVKTTCTLLLYITDEELLFLKLRFTTYDNNTGYE